MWVKHGERKYLLIPQTHSTVEQECIQQYHQIQQSFKAKNPTFFVHCVPGQLSISDLFNFELLFIGQLYTIGILLSSSFTLWVTLLVRLWHRFDRWGGGGGRGTGCYDGPPSTLIEMDSSNLSEKCSSQTTAAAVLTLTGSNWRTR